MRIGKIFYLILFFLFVLAVDAQAASLYWVGSAGGNVSDANNWAAASPSSCTGGGAGALGASDTAYFTAGCTNNATIDAGWSVGGVDIASGYTGTITANGALTASGAFSLAGGTFNANGQAMNFTSYSQTGGTFTAGASAISSTGNYSVTGGTYNANTSTLSLESNGATLIFTGDGYTFNNITFKNSAATSGTVRFASGTFNINGDFLLSALTNALAIDLTTNNPVIHVGGNVDTGGLVAAALTNPSFEDGINGWTNTGAPVTVTTSQAHDGTHSVQVGYGFTGNQGLTQTFPPATVTSLSFWYKGTIEDYYDDVSVILRTSGTYCTGTSVGNGSTVTYGDWTQYTFSSLPSCANQLTSVEVSAYNNYSDVTNMYIDDFAITGVWVGGSGTKTINAGTGDFTVNGNMNLMLITFTPGSSHVIFQGSGTQAVTSNGNIFHNVTVNNSGSVVLQDTFAANGTFSLSGGTFNMNNKAMSVMSHFTIANGTTFTKGTEALTLKGNLTFTDNRVVKASIGDVLIGDGSDTVTLATDMVTDILRITNGTDTLDASTGTPTITINEHCQLFGTFVAGSSTVVLEGGGTASVQASSALFNLTVNRTGIASVAWHALVVQGVFSLSQGTFTNSNQNMSVAGNFTITDGTTFTPGTGTLTLNGNLTYTDNRTTKASIGNVVIGDGADTVTLATDLWTNNLTIASTNTLDAATGTRALVVNGNWNATGGTFTRGSSTVTMTGTGSTTVTSAGVSFNHFTKSGTGTVTLSDALPVVGNLTISAGTLDLNGYAPTVTGNLSNSATLKIKGGETVSVTGTVTHDAASLVNYYGTTGGPFTMKNWTYGNLQVSGTGQTFNMPASLTLNGGLTVSAGTLVMGTYDMSVAGNFLLSGGTFTKGSGTITFNGSGTFTDSITTNVGKVSVAGTFTLATDITADEIHFSSGTFTTADKIVTTGLYDQTGGTFSAGASYIISTGDYSVTGGTYTAGTSVLKLNANGGILVFTGNGYAFNTIFFYNGGTADGTVRLAAGTYVLAGSFLLYTNTYALTIDLSTHNPAVTVGGDLEIVTNVVLNPGFEDGLNGWVINSGSPAVSTTYAHSGTYSLYGTSYTLTQSFPPTSITSMSVWHRGIGSGYSTSAGVSLYASGVYCAGVTLSDDSDWRQYTRSSLPSCGTRITSVRVFLSDATSWVDDFSFVSNQDDGGGVKTINAGSGDLTLNGNVDLTGITFNVNTSHVKFKGSGTLKFVSQALNNVTFDKVGGAWTLQDDLTAAGTFDLLNGTLTLGANTVTVYGNFTASGGTLTQGTSKLLLDTTNNDIAWNVDGYTFHHVYVKNTSNVRNGVVTSSNGTISIDGNLYSQATGSGTVALNVPSGSTFNFSGADQQIDGSFSFYNLTKALPSATARILTFGAGTTTTVANTLTLTGYDASRRLFLRSSSPGVAWSINPQGTRTVSYLTVQDSNNINAVDVDCTTTCVDATNNTKWNFGAAVAPTFSVLFSEGL